MFTVGDWFSANQFSTQIVPQIVQAREWHSPKRWYIKCDERTQRAKKLTGNEYSGIIVPLVMVQEKKA